MRFAAEPYPTPDRTVYAIGAAAREAADFYGRRTRRRVVNLELAGGFRPRPGDVVVCDTSQITAELLHQLYAQPDLSDPCGLICAGDEAELLLVCRALAARLDDPSPLARRRILIDGNKYFARFEIGEDIAFGASALREEVISELAAEPAVTVVYSHTDGLMLHLGARTLLCALVEGASRPSSRPPRCQDLGRCTQIWSHPPIDEAIRSGGLVGLSTLKGGIGVIFGCGVLRPEDGALDPRHTLAPALLAQAGFGAIITTWRNEQSTSDPSWLINRLCEGVPIGRVAGEFNRSSAGRRDGVRLCVLGDPELRLATASAFPEFRLPAAPAAPASSPDPQALQGPLDHLGSALEHIAANRHEYDSSRLRELIARLQKDGRCAADERSIAVELLELLSVAPYLEKMYDPLAIAREHREGGACPVCGAPARTTRVLLDRGACARRIVLCAACGPAVNVPEDWSISVATSSGRETVVVSGLPERSVARVCATTLSGSAEPFGSQLHQSAEAAVAAGGVLTARLAIPRNVGPIWFHILVASLPEIGSISIRTRPAHA